jgi:ABC-type bacteriocin/lantibiotic exporter with double-glycine peptidase domain
MSRLSYFLGNVKMLEFPEFRQVFNYDCGANALQSILVYYGFAMREDKIMELAGTTEKNGTPVDGIVKVAKMFKLDVEIRENMTVEDIKKYIDEGFPVLIPMQAWPDFKEPKWEDIWGEGHYCVCLGYDDKRIYFEDPAAPLRTYVPVDEFEVRWHDEDGDGNRLEHFGIIIKGTPKYKYNDSTKME